MMFNLASAPVEAWIASVYAIGAVTIAWVIDLLAKRAATTAEGGKSTAGFVYHEDHDAWLCPEDQWLWPQSFDPDNRVMRYRATPSICNSCPVKDTCTTSDSGREVQRSVDEWPASEAARFHRWIACSVVIFGLIFPAAIALSNPGPAGLLIIAVGSTIALLMSLPLWSHLRRSPANFPELMVATKTLDASELDREAEAAAYARRRTTYRSDHRADSGVDS